MANINFYHIKHNTIKPKTLSSPCTRGLRQSCFLQMLPIKYIQITVKDKSLVLVQLEASPTNNEGRKLVCILGCTFLFFSYSPFYFSLETHTCLITHTLKTQYATKFSNWSSENVESKSIPYYSSWVREKLANFQVKTMALHTHLYLQSLFNWLKW